MAPKSIFNLGASLVTKCLRCMASTRPAASAILQNAPAPTEDTSNRGHLSTLIRSLEKRAPVPRSPTRRMEKSSQTISQESKMRPSPNPAPSSTRDSLRTARTGRSQSCIPEPEKTHNSQSKFYDCDTEFYWDLKESEEVSEVDPLDSPQVFAPNSQSGPDEISGPLISEWNKNPLIAPFIAEAEKRL